MAKLLSNSLVDRKNILNNPFAVNLVQKKVGIKGIKFEGEFRYTLRQIAAFFEVELRTVENYLAEYRVELEHNGYEVLVGSRLAKFRELFDTETDFGIKTRRLGIFTFKAFLNLGMLLRESEKARQLRSIILDIVIDVVGQKTGGSTKYINQRDPDYLMTLYKSEGYKEEFINALKYYVEMGDIKYPIYTDKIYQSIFKERAREYKRILELKRDDKVRDTFYTEVLITISMYEVGIAKTIKREHDSLKRKLTFEELDKLFAEFEKNPILEPQLDSARIKMASRDYGLRDKIHPKLIDYIGPVNPDDFERFLGEKSKSLGEKIKEYQDVFKRLKDK